MDSFKKLKVKFEINKILFEAATGIYDSPETENPKTIIPQYSLLVSNPEKFDDNDATFGKHVGTELRSIRNTNGQQMAKLKICNTLCQATVEDRIAVQTGSKIEFV